MLKCFRGRLRLRYLQTALIASAVAGLSVWNCSQLVGQTSSLPPSNGLLAYWPGEGNADDEYGELNGVLMNGTSFHYGLIGDAFSLDGVNDYVAVPDPDAIHPSLSESITISAWVYWDGTPKQGQVFAYGDSASDDANTFLFVYIFTDGTPRFWTRMAHSDASSREAVAAPLSPGQWHQLVAVREFGNSTDGTKLFVDGVLAATAADSGIPFDLDGFSSRPITIGVRNIVQVPTGNISHFPGLLDEVAIYDRALTAEEIADYYQSCINQDPIADAGDDVTVECAGQLTTVALSGSGSSDPDNDQLEFEWSVPAESGATLDDPTSASPTGQFPLGPTLVTLTVTDGNGGIAVDDVLVTVQDTTPPVLVCTTDQIALWPPDHTMRAVTISIAVSDNCAAPEDLLLNCTVSSNEPDDGTGDGAHTGDVDGSDGFTAPVNISGDLTYFPDSGRYVGLVLLRAERDGTATGRTYSIVCDVLDTEGNAATASCVVVVPHDKRKR